MSVTNSYKVLLLWVALLMMASATAHPTGNMISVDGHVLWSYIAPLDDPNHHACIMIWEKDSEPKVLLKSTFPASDFMLYNNNDTIYLIERRYISDRDKFEVRVLKFQLGASPKEIWGWFQDDWRIGEAGFIMPSDQRIIFGSYPNIYVLEHGRQPSKYFEFETAIKKIRQVENDNLLLLGEDKIWLTTARGTILKTWSDLINKEIKDAPLNRNQIFDADYSNERLLVAYWGNRSFELIGKEGKRENILQLQPSWAPHWVAFRENDLLLFASYLDFSGKIPKPNLVLYKANNVQKTLWKLEK